MDLDLDYSVHFAPHSKGDRQYPRTLEDGIS